MSQAPTLLEMRSITKTFPGVKALADVNLAVREGEIHAICGENGAGKSTLMKVLSGVHPHGSYSGEIVYRGEQVRFSGIRASEQAGIVIIHQELALVPGMSITENIFLGNEPRRRGSIDWKAAQHRALELMEQVGLQEDPDTLVKDIGVGKQQLVEIAKAFAKDVKLLILDEPTAALNEDDSQHLLDLLRGFRARGITSIIISHKLNEIEAIADSITILRDGRTIETLDVKADGVNEDRIVRGMVGRELSSRFPDRTPDIGEVFFEVRDWTVRHPSSDERLVCKGSTFTVRRGEIVGFAGLMGAGRTELAMSLFGRSYGSWLSGQVFKDGTEIQLKSVADAIRHGLAYVSEDRKSIGLNLLDDIKTSMVAAKLSKITRRGVVDPVREHRIAEDYRTSLRIKTPQRGRGRRQALRRQPAEGRAGEVDVHRPGPADPRRAHPRHRRGRQVRDLRHHPAAREPGEGRRRHLLGAAGADRTVRPHLHGVRRHHHRRGPPP
ncbi:sugar ABC transporter ATP-binding protein [Streptomyces cinereospinus]